MGCMLSGTLHGSWINPRRGPRCPRCFFPSKSSWVLGSRLCCCEPTQGSAALFRLMVQMRCIPACATSDYHTFHLAPSCLPTASRYTRTACCCFFFPSSIGCSTRFINSDAAARRAQTGLEPVGFFGFHLL